MNAKRKWLIGLIGSAVCTLTGFAGSETVYPVDVMDTEDISFYADETSAWRAKDATSGNRILVSGRQMAYQSSTLRAVVVGSGTLSFAWKCSGSGYFNVHIDGNYMSVNGGGGYVHGREYSESFAIRGDPLDEHIIEWEVESYSDGATDLLTLSEFSWSVAPDSMTVTFDVNGGTELDPVEYYSFDTVYFSDIPTPERDGYDFYGWFYDQELTKEVDMWAFVDLENITLYAGWMRPVSLLDNGTLSFSSSSWSVEDGLGVDGGPAAAAIVRPRNDGLRVGFPVGNGTFSFKGRTTGGASLDWQTMVGCEHNWVFSFRESGYSGLSGEWKTYLVEVLCGDLPTCNNGYEDCPSAHIDIYVNGRNGATAFLSDFEWTPAPETVKIHFNTLCDAKLDSVEVPPGGVVSTADLPVPTYRDWVFSGWYMLAESDGMSVATPMGDSCSVPLHDITLVAKWRLPVSEMDADGVSFSSSDGWEAAAGTAAWWNSAPDSNLKIAGMFSGQGDLVDESYVPAKQKQTLVATVPGPSIFSVDVSYSDLSERLYYGFGGAAYRGNATFTISLDGKVHASWSESESDVVKVVIPEGKHKVSFELSGTPSVWKVSDGWRYDEDEDDYIETFSCSILSPQVSFGAFKNISTASRASFGEWLSAIRGGTWISGDLQRFRGEYEARIALNPDDCEARVMHAATLLVELGESKTVQQYASKFGFALDYLGLSATHKPTSPGSWPAVNALVDSFVKEAVPVIKSALKDLESIPSEWDGCVVLDADEFPVDETVYVDAADVLYARSALEAAVGGAYFAQGYDFTVDYAKAKTASEYRRLIPVAKSVPSMYDDTGWEAAMANGKSKFLISGTKLYVRFATDMLFQPDTDYYLNLFFLDTRNGDKEYELTISAFDGAPEIAAWGTPDDIMQAAVFEDSAALKRLYNAEYEVAQSDDGSSVTFAFDFSGKRGALAAGTWYVDDGELIQIADVEDEYGSYSFPFASFSVGNFDTADAVVYKMISEQTKFMSKIRNASSLAMSRSWMTAAFNRALAADIAVQSRSDDLMHFIEYDSLDEEDIARARSLTEKALAALSSVQTVDVGQEVIGDRETRFDLSLLPNDGVMQIYLGALFEGRITRDLLPTLLKDANEGPVPVVETITDPTLAGLLPEFTAKTWSHILQDRGISVAHQTVTLKLDTNGGKLPKGALASISLDFDEDSEECYYPELPVPERAGFIFTGWAAAKSGGEAVHYGDAYDASLFVGAKTPTLYAQWLQLYALTVKGGAACHSASWDWSDEQRKALPDAALEGDFERVLDGKGVVNVPAGANVWIYAADGTEGRGDKWLTFQKWTPSSAKANLGASFKVGESETQFVMPAEKLTMTATYIDEATCGWLTAEAWANEVNVGWSDELGDDVYINPPYEAFEWSPDGKTWYKSGDSALLKAGSYTVSWRSTDPRWSPPSLKEKVKVEAGDEVSPMSASFFFTYVPQVVVDVMTFENGELRKSSAGGTVAMNPKDGLVPTDKTVALTAKANKNYAFQGWALAKYWEYGDHFDETSATWKLLNSANYCSYPATGWLNSYIDPDDGMVHVLAVFKALADYSADDIVINGFEGSNDRYIAVGEDGSVMIKAVVGCALGDEFALACDVAATPLAYKLNGKLPDGLKFDAKTGILSGAPKKAGKTTVTIVAMDPAKNAKSLTVNFDIAPLPLWLVGEYRGAMSDTSYTPGYWDEDEQTWVGEESLPGHQQGVLELSVKSDGKVSAKLLTSVGTRSVSGTLSWFPEEDDAESEGTFTFTAKMTKDDEECDVEFYPDGTISGYAASYSKSEDTYLGGKVEGMRQDEELLAQSPFLDKYYTFAFSAEAEKDEETMQSGYGYLTIKTDKKGSAKVTGQLPDSEKVSMSALVMPFVDDESEALKARLYVFASPSSYKKQDWFAMSLVMWDDGTITSEGDAAWTIANIPGGLCDSPQTANVYGSGALYSEAKSLENHYWMAYCEYNENVQLEYTCKATYKEGGKTYTDTWPETASARGFSSEFLDNDCFFCVAVQGDAKGAISLKEKSPAPWARAYKEGSQSFMEWEYSEDKNGKKITDPSQLSISFTKATGIFTGKAKVYFDYEVFNYKNGEEIWTKQHKDATLPYSGVMIYDGEGGYNGYGSAVHTFKYTDYDENERPKTVTKKVTLPVSLDPADGE